jgi:hypothetical protein
MQSEHLMLWWDHGRAQNRTVIYPMYIEDADVMNVSKIIRGDPEGWQIAKNALVQRSSPILLT